MGEGGSTDSWNFCFQEFASLDTGLPEVYDRHFRFVHSTSIAVSDSLPTWLFPCSFLHPQMEEVTWHHSDQGDPRAAL